ncbi:MAG: hypothetical protein IJ128_03300 [Firmicutes bacterium]|nr:hypothetical protein [Bacillota bacterium]
MKYQHLIFVLLAAFAVMFLWGLEPAAASEDAQSYPAVTLSQTVDGVTVTLEAPEGALPEGTTMRVEPVDRTDVYGAVEKKFTAKGKSMSDAAAFDVTPMDKDGNEIQPLKEVKVTFRGTGLDASDQGIDVYRVSDDAKTLKKMDTSLATADEQEFGTDHFTIYVSGGSVEDPNGDGGGGNYKNHAYLLPYGEEATFCSNESSILGEEWYIHSNVETDSLTHVGGSTFKNTNNYGHDTLVVIAHSYGWGPWHGFEQFYVQPVRKKVTVTPYLKKVGDTEFKQYADPETRWAGDKKSLSFPNPDQYAVGEDSKVYTFDGWYTDEECTKKMDVVYDRWTKRPLYRFYYNTKLYGRYIDQKVD